MSMNCLIIVYGVVGGNLNRELEKLNCDICDKYKNIKKKLSHHDVAFVCVDTPLVTAGELSRLDLKEVENAIMENDADVYVIKSTVKVGFTENLADRLGKRIVFSPEYYGGTQHCNNFNFNFTVLGGNKTDCIMVQQLLQTVYDARHKFFLTSSRVAEMAKFMENSWLATKVSFCCDFFDACEYAGISYEDVREIFVADPRVNPSHTFVYREHPFYSSHCLNKDVPAIADQFDMELMKFIVKNNKKRSERY